jgi:hypothetical protein
MKLGMQEFVLLSFAWMDKVEYNKGHDMGGARWSPPPPSLLPPPLKHLIGFKLLPGWTWTTSGLCFCTWKCNPQGWDPSKPINEIHITPPSQISWILTYLLPYQSFILGIFLHKWEKNKNKNLLTYLLSKYIMRCFEHQNLAQNDSHFEHHNIYIYIYR